MPQRDAVRKTSLDPVLMQQEKLQRAAAAAMAAGLGRHLNAGVSSPSTDIEVVDQHQLSVPRVEAIKAESLMQRRSRYCVCVYLLGFRHSGLYSSSVNFTLPTVSLFSEEEYFRLKSSPVDSCAY